MSGTINSLGLGSGVLTADLLDKLKAADTAGIVTPIDNKITLNTQKGQALDLLTSLLNSFKSSASALDDDTLYQKRTVSGGNEYASVSASTGSQIRDFSLDVTNIAQKNVLQSGTFSSSTTSVASVAGTLNLGIGGTNYSINYTAGMSLDDLKQAINDVAGKSVSASVLQTGTSAYSLVITSKNTGQNQTIALSDVTGNLNTNLVPPQTATGAFVAADAFVAVGGTAPAVSTGTLNVNIGTTTVGFAYDETTTLQGIADKINADSTLNSKVSANIVQYGTSDYRMVLTPKSGSVASAITITDTILTGNGLYPTMTATASTAGASQIVQDAKDANFTFDGISMSRSTNTITDISAGMTINLLKKGGSANISITQNRDQIVTEMGSMVSSYNTLIKQLGDMTAYDATAGKVGIFNGDNTIKNISREITKIITNYNTNGSSLPQYGISLDRTGTMKLDTNVFTAKLNADPTGTEAFFSGKTTVTSVGTTNTGSFSTTSSLVSSGVSGTMALNIGSTSYSFSYTNTTTLQQMADNLNANAILNTKLSASILQFGTNDYRMVLTPKNDAVGESISISDSTVGGLLSTMTSTISSSDAVKTTDGVFTSLNNLLKGYTSSSTGLLNNLTTASKAETTSLNEERSKANKLLEARYATLQAKFAAYDSMISKLNSQFSSLKQQIDAQAKASN